MKKTIFFTLSVLIILTLFTLVLRYLPFVETKPDIILIIIIYLAIASDDVADIFIAFIMGYFFDIFSGNPVGLFAMLRTVTFIITRFLNMNFFSKNALFFIVYTFFFSIFDSIYLGYQFKNNGYGFINILLVSLYFSFINALAAAVMYPLLARIEGIYLKFAKEHEGL